MKKLFRRHTSLFIVALLTVFILSFTLGGCGQDTAIEEENTKQEENNEEERNNEEKSWPEEKTVTIEIEGMTEELETSLYRNDNLGFLTYYPDNMLAEDNNDQVGFYYERNGELNEEAYVKFTKHQHKDLDLVVEEVLVEEGWEVFEESAENDRYDFADEIKAFDNPGLNRTALVLAFESQDELYSFVLQYQYEYGDGFYPRAGIIIDNFYWIEENEYLINR